MGQNFRALPGAPVLAVQGCFYDQLGIVFIDSFQLTFQIGLSAWCYVDVDGDLLHVLGYI